MLKPPVESFFEHLERCAIHPAHQSVERPHKTAQLNHEELVGLEVFGGFHHKAEIYRDFRGVFSALMGTEDIEDLNQSAYKASLLFGSLERFQGIHKRFGRLQHLGAYSYVTPNSLFDNIQFPDPEITDYSKIAFDRWLSFLSKTGLSELSLIMFEYYAAELTPPDPETTRYFVRETIVQVANCIVETDVPFEDEKIQAICRMARAQHSRLNLNEFSRAVTYHLTARKAVEAGRVNDFPDLVLDGEHFGMPGSVFKKLPHDDPRLPLIGIFSGCCETVSDKMTSVESSIAHAMMSEESTFYVVEDETGEIVAHSWAWLGNGDELVFDGFESFKTNFDMDNLDSLMDVIAHELTSNPHKYYQIKAVMLGRCAEHLDDLRLIRAFNDVGAARAWDLMMKDSFVPRTIDGKGMTYKTLAYVCDL